MPGRKGTFKAENGKYYTPEDMERLGLRPALAKNRAKASVDLGEESGEEKPKRKRRRRKPITSTQTEPDTGEINTYQTLSVEEPQKMTIPKKELPGNQSHYPRVSIITFDDKGRHLTTTYIVKPDTFNVEKNETLSFTANGTPKKQLFINMGFDVIEIE